MNHVGFTTFNNNIQKAVGEKDVEMLAVRMKDSIKSSNKANNSKLLNIENSLVVTATALIQPHEEIYVAYDLWGYCFRWIQQLLDMCEEDVCGPFRVIIRLYEKAISLLPKG